MSKNGVLNGMLVVFFLLISTNGLAQNADAEDYTIVKGDTLWDISKSKLNDPFQWSKIWKENPAIANPDRIYPDQKLKIPSYLLKSASAEGQQSAAVSEASSAEATSGATASSKDALGEMEKSTIAAHQPSEAAGKRYKDLKGVVLTDGSVIEGEILSLNVYKVVIREQSGTVRSYSFEEEVENFIKE